MVAAGEHLSFSRPARRAARQNRARIPVCVTAPPPFVEGPGPGRDWWEKALSEKSFSRWKHKKAQQNQGVGAKSRTTTLGPFGEPLRASGPLAKENPFRFSSKYHDDETDLVYFGYCYYSASTGRWLSRDPVGQAAGLNLYAFVENNPLSGVDYLGQWNLWSPGSYGVANAAGWTVADSFNPFHESTGYEWDTLRQSLGSTLEGLTGRDWGLHYDRCDPAQHSARGTPPQGRARR